MLKGFLHVSEITIMAMLIFVMMYQFSTIPRISIEWERPKLLLMAYDIMYSMDRSGIDWTDAEEVKMRFDEALPTTMGFSLTTKQDIRPAIRIGCVCNQSEFDTLQQEVFTDFDLNGMRRTLRMQRIDPDNIKFSSENDVTIFWKYPDITDLSQEDINLRRYLSEGKGVVEFGKLESWQADNQWHKDIFNLQWVSDSTYVKTAVAKFPLFTPTKKGYQVEKVFYHMPYELSPDSSTVGYWRMNLGRGRTAWDTGQDSHHGVMRDADWTNYDGNNASEWVRGKYSYALEFDGVDDYIEVPDDPRLSIDDELTIEAWVKYSKQTETGDHSIVWSAADRRYSLKRTDDNYRFMIYDASTSTWHIVDTAGITFEKDVWYHIAATYRNGDMIKIYVNGTLSNQLPIPFITLNPQSGFIRFGAGQNITGPGTEWFNGTIDELIIHDRELGPGEVWQHYERSMEGFRDFSNFVSESVYPLDNMSDKIIVEQESRYTGGSMNGKSVPLAVINWGAEGSGRSAWMSSAGLSPENKQLMRSLVIWAAGEKDYDVVQETGMEQTVKASMLKIFGSEMQEILRVDLTIGFFY